jgi:hypothetical protein
MRYDDIYKNFLESKEQPGLENIKESGGFHPYMMKPEDLQSVLNAVDAFDLYQRPDKTPSGVPSFMALNNREPLAFGGPRNDIFFSEDANSIRSPIGKEFDRYALQGVYEHELGHATDPRINWSRGLKNRGYVMKHQGMPQGIRSREELAMDAEHSFWGSIKDGTFNL